MPVILLFSQRRPDPRHLVGSTRLFDAEPFVVDHVGLAGPLLSELNSPKAKSGRPIVWWAFTRAGLADVPMGDYPGWYRYN